MSFSIVIGGDFFPANLHNNNECYDKKIWGNSISLFQKAELSIINLEAPLTTTNNAINKTGPNIKLSPRCVKILGSAGIDAATLANNHIRDFGDQGVMDTISICEDKSIEIVGAGRDLTEASKTLYKIVKKKKIAIVNFAENEWASADEKHSGANPYDIISCAKQIREAKKLADVVIVIIHGGHELYHYPSPRMVKEYRFFAEQGASAIISHHTHCVTGYEIHRGVPIFYSIGNLFFPSKTNFEGWYEGFIVKLTINPPNTIDFEIIPYTQNKNAPRIELLSGDEKQASLDSIKFYSSVISCEDKLQHKWDEFIQTKCSMNGYMVSLLIPFSFIGRVLNKLKISKLFVTQKSLKLLLNLVRCEAHRDSLITWLENKLQRNQK